MQKFYMLMLVFCAFSWGTMLQPTMDPEIVIRINTVGVILTLLLVTFKVAKQFKFQNPERNDLSPQSS